MEPMLLEARTVTAPRWTQRVLEGMLSTLSVAIGAVLELPDRAFAPCHRSVVDADIEALCRFFLRAAGGALEEVVVRSSVAFLHALAEQACAGRPQ